MIIYCMMTIDYVWHIYIYFFIRLLNYTFSKRIVIYLIIRCLRIPGRNTRIASQVYRDAICIHLFFFFFFLMGRNPCAQNIEFPVCKQCPLTYRVRLKLIILSKLCGYFTLFFFYYYSVQCGHTAAEARTRQIPCNYNYYNFTEYINYYIYLRTRERRWLART